MKVNPLIGVLNPRELTEFKNCIDKITNVDKLFIKYFTPESDAYYSLRLWFLMHPEYSHLIICPDDITFTPEHINMLIEGIEKFNFPVLTGYANLDLSNPDLYSVGLEGEYIERSHRQYKLLTKAKMFNPDGTCKLGRYFQCKWAGFGFTTIRRDIVERIPFEDDARFNGMRYGTACCVDTVFSYQCNIKGIPMFCDSKVKITHLREGKRSLMRSFYAGIKPREIILEKEGKKIYEKR